jgi:putative membrane protein
MQIQTLLSSACCLALLVSAGPAGGASLGNADKEFVITAAKNDMTEAHEGQMAESHANRGNLKIFAKTLIQDHSKSYQHLSELAAKTGVIIPKGIDAAKDPTIMQLVHLKGEKFDRSFITDEIAAHRHAIAIFKREAKLGQDADVKAYATKMIPVLKKHLRLAEDCAKPARPRVERQG